MVMKLLTAALSHKAKLLKILDRATSGLDPIVQDDILDLLFNSLRTNNTASSSLPISPMIWKKSQTMSPSCTRKLVLSAERISCWTVSES